MCEVIQSFWVNFYEEKRGRGVCQAPEIRQQRYIFLFSKMHVSRRWRTDQKLIVCEFLIQFLQDYIVITMSSELSNVMLDYSSKSECESTGKED